MVKEFLLSTRLPIAMPEEIASMPNLPGDNNDFLMERTPYDERINIDLADLCKSPDVGDFFKEVISGGRQWIVGKKFYRCPNFFWLATKFRITGKNKASDAVWVGPFECGNMLNAFSDWQHLRRTGTSGRKNI